MLLERMGFFGGYWTVLGRLLEEFLVPFEQIFRGKILGKNVVLFLDPKNQSLLVFLVVFPLAKNLSFLWKAIVWSYSTPFKSFSFLKNIFYTWKTLHISYFSGLQCSSYNLMIFAPFGTISILWVPFLLCKKVFNRYNAKKCGSEGVQTYF